MTFFPSLKERLSRVRTVNNRKKCVKVKMVPVVEVFAMHIDRTHVTNINPNIRALGLEPTKRNAPKAIRLCKFVSSIEIATEFG